LKDTLKNKYKRENNEAFYLLTKLFLNSLYGKFGEKNERWIVIEGEGDDFRAERIYDFEGKRWIYHLEVQGKIYEKLSDCDEGFNSFPAIASHVTAYARMYLWHLIKTAGLENVYYVDTDSLIVNEVGYNNLRGYLDEEELGKLKLEGVSEYLRIGGAKDYTFGENVKVKGVKDVQPFLDLIESNMPIELVQERFLRLRGLANKGVADGVIVEKYTKRLKRNYDKGVVLDGKVMPFNVDLWGGNEAEKNECLDGVEE